MLKSLCGKVLGIAYAQALLSLFLLPPVGATICPSEANVQAELIKRLSRGSSLDNSTVDAPRWSLYGAPTPRFVVSVAAESDVAITVKYCNKYNLAFLLQSRGNGWANTFHLGKCGILINISGLNRIKINAQKTQVTIQGGALVQDMVHAAYGNDTRLSNPTCNCLGFLGASLGGGITRDMGLYGMAVDQIISVNLVTASGQMLHVDQNHHPDLWYAVRGAASNFGVVTSAVIRAYPTPKAQNIAWSGPVVFSDEKLESMIQAIHDLELTPQMQIDFLFSMSGAPSNKPMITAIPFYLGNASAAEKAFEPILRVGPISNGATELPYTQWGAFSDGFCVKGHRKPAYGVSLARQGLVPATWRTVFDDFKKFIAAYPEAGETAILAEYYPLQKALAIGSATSSYPFRDVPIHVVAIPSYDNKSLDGAATAYGSQFRDALRSTDGLARNSTYINFASGDEPLETVYGESLSRLQGLKKRYDSHNRFNQWFPLV